MVECESGEHSPLLVVLEVCTAALPRILLILTVSLDWVSFAVPFLQQSTLFYRINQTYRSAYLDRVMDFLDHSDYCGL